MALNKEDHQDVKRAMGKALADKVARATRDKIKDATFKAMVKQKTPSAMNKTAERGNRAIADMAEGRYRKLRPLGGEGKTTEFASYKPDKTHDEFKKDSHKGLSMFPSNKKYYKKGR